MSKYEDFKVSEDNSNESEIKPYNLNASDWSVGDTEQENNEDNQMQEVPETSGKHKMSKKNVIICVIACVIILIIIVCIAFFVGNNNKNEISEFIDEDNTYYDENNDTLNVDGAETTTKEKEETTTKAKAEKTTKAKADTTTNKKQNTNNKETTTVKSTDQVTLWWPGSESNVKEDFGEDFNLEIVYVYSSTTEKGYMYDMNPSAGSVVEKGSTITVYISLGDVQDAWSDWSEEIISDNPNVEYEEKKQYRYKDYTEHYSGEELVDIQEDDWSDWVDGSVPEGFGDRSWYTDLDEGLEYCLYSEVEERTVYRYRELYDVVD